MDTEMLRRGWPQVVEGLKQRRKMIAYANAQLATVGKLEGDELELILPPGKTFNAGKLEEKQAEVRSVLQELYGITPTIRCTVRQGMTLEPEAEEPPASPEAAEALLRAQFGAEVVEEE